jgi:acetate kinase
MLPNEAWLQIMKSLSKERVELKTGSNKLNEIEKTFFAKFDIDRLVISSMPGVLGFEPIETPIEVDYVEFASVFPMYFSKMRFDNAHYGVMKNSKYIFPVIKKYVVDAVNDSGSMFDTVENPKDDENNQNKKKNLMGGF